MGGGQDKPAWTACPHPGGEDNQGGGKITRDSLPPGGGNMSRGVKINCYTGTTYLPEKNLTTKKQSSELLQKVMHVVKLICGIRFPAKRLYMLLLNKEKITAKIYFELNVVSIQPLFLSVFYSDLFISRMQFIIVKCTVNDNQ